MSQSQTALMPSHRTQTHINYVTLVTCCKQDIINGERQHSEKETGGSVRETVRETNTGIERDMHSERESRREKMREVEIHTYTERERERKRERAR